MRAPLPGCAAFGAVVSSGGAFVGSAWTEGSARGDSGFGGAVFADLAFAFVAFAGFAALAAFVAFVALVGVAFARLAAAFFAGVALAVFTGLAAAFFAGEASAAFAGVASAFAGSSAAAWSGFSAAGRCGGPGFTPFAGGVPLLCVEGDDEWCVAGMTAPVRVNVGGRMGVWGGGSGGTYGGAFPP
jgi:hypothetical protein